MGDEVVGQRGEEGKAAGESARYAEVFTIAHAEMIAMAPRRTGLAQRAIAAALRVPAVMLARSLTALDHDLAQRSLADSARRRLSHYGASLAIDRRSPSIPGSGPLLVVSNHPGLFDALALFAAVGETGRDDLSILAARRPLLTALPNLSRRLLSIDPGASGSVALKKAVRHLRQGAALLHFPAGQIEPDPRVAPRSRALLLPWKAGLDTLLGAASRGRDDVRVVVAAVSGVVSRRALALSTFASRGADKLTDAFVPLLQLTVPGFADAQIVVRFGEPRAAAITSAESLRAELAALTEAARP
ncbi:MAG: 1-acyl-sn-glycerol-3-phosphate acyltransferase [Byssovorax sp.]